MRELEKIRNMLQIISKKHSFEIITHCQIKPSTVTEISNQLNIPYMTAKTRVIELVSVDILQTAIKRNIKNNKKTKSYKTRDFNITINPKKISEYIYTTEP